MERLDIAPQNYEIQLAHNGIDRDDPTCVFAEVMFTFGETSGSHCFDAEEAKAVGDWFIQFAKELGKKK